MLLRSGIDAALKGLSPSRDQIVSFKSYLLSRFAILVVLYLLSFLLLAVIRVFTGISIKRLGYFSLCNISYSPSSSVTISIHKVGLSFHRPTFLHPGWLSLYISDLDVSIDSELIAEQRSTSLHNRKKSTTTDETTFVSPETSKEGLVFSAIPQNSILFHLIKLGLNYGKYFDFKAINSSFTLIDVGSFLVGNLDFKIDLRKNTNQTDQNKFIGTLDNHKLKPGEAPAWIRLLVQDVFFSPDGRAKDLKTSQMELFDFFVLDSRGVVGKSNLAIKDFSASCRFGVVNIQADQIIQSITSLMEIKAQVKSTPPEDLATRLNAMAGNSALASILTSCVRIIKEIEFKVTSFSVYKLPLDFLVEKSFPDYTLAFTSKDFSLDLRRLNSKNPAFRLFFSDDDTAHQAIWTCSSVMLGLDHNGVQEELIYIPLITAISKTNIFSKTINFSDQTVEDRNKTIVRANINVTTPSINIEPHHIGLLFAAFLLPHDKTPSMRATTSSFQKFWPRAVIKFTIDEPATRVLVHQPEGIHAPIPYAKLALSKEISGMVVHSCSKVHCDFESSHVYGKNGESTYNFQASFHISAFEAWYRSSEGLRFDFLNTDSLSLQLYATLNPALSASISGQVKCLRVLSIHSEVLYGIREVLKNIKQYECPKPVPPGVTETEFAMRKLPVWLRSITFEIDSVTVAVAADELEHYISTSRGVKLTMAKINVNYYAKSTLTKHDNVTYESTDHRLAEIIIQGVKGHKILGLYHENDKLENKFLDIPSFGVSISTDRDTNGPLKTFNFDLPSVYFHWDPNLQYMISLCLALVRMSLAVENNVNKPKKLIKQSDFLKLNFKINFANIKATFPENVLALLELNSVHFKISRGSYTSLLASTVRLYAEHPTIANSWTRVITIRNLGVNIKDSLKNLGKPYEHDLNEQILITSDAIRVNFAYQLVIYKLIDNLITGFKSIITLTRRAMLNQPKYIFPLSEKEKMPNIPKIRIKSNNIMLTFEDDLFEAKLGLIFQVGLHEQKKRLENEAAFEAKLEAIRLAKKSTSKENHSVDEHQMPPPEETVKASQRRQTGNKSDFAKSVRQPSLKEPVTKIPEKRPQGFHKIIPTSTFRSFQNSIHPFHSSIRRQNKAENSNKFKMSDIEQVSKEAHVEPDTARYRLQKMFSESWIKTYDAAEKNLKISISEQLKSTGVDDQVSPEMASQERIVEYSPFPFLFFLLIAKVDWFISKPNMSDTEMRKFLYDVGKGFPKDRNFSILIPLFNQLQCTAIRAQLRDYPLPLLYFPHLNPSQPSDLPSINIQGNFIIAEDFSMLESNIRRVFVPIDPLAFDHYTFPTNPKDNPFMVEVHRTVASIKMYTDLSVDIRTINPSVITWCVSMQPAMQAFMQVFDLFSKPPLDPSEKLGFWDKIRSVFHARLTLKWAEGDVHLKLKGSSNPYHVVGDNAGFVMCWRNNVVLKVNPDDDPKRFVTVNSNDYVLAIPDFSFQEREYLSKSFDKSGGLACSSNFFDSTIFQKIIMKLSGRVTWTAGLLFERKKGNSGRTFQFKPHYDVVLRNPATITDLTNYDAYGGFRSDFLHLAISVVSIPQDDDDFVSYNSVHLTPKFFAHFFKWWHLFDGALSLPVRAGPLFHSGTETKSKKFGRHLFTVKYQLHLTPLFATHGYVHTSYHEEKKTCLHTVNGLKVKVDEFVMDLHQRRAQAGPGKRWKMGLNVGELDIIGSDLRVVTASFTEKPHEELLAKNLGISSSSFSSSASNLNTPSSESQFSGGKFNISDNDLSWIDPDDYVEVGESSYSNSNPKITIMSLSYTPRWTYFRQTDHGPRVGKTIPFGNEPSHSCLIGKDQSVNIRQDLLKNRLTELEEQLKTNETMLESLQKNLDEFPNTPELAERVVQVQVTTGLIKERISKVSEILGIKNATFDKVQVALEQSANEITKNLKRRKQSVYYIDDTDIPPIDSVVNDMDDMPADGNSFNNIFIIHSTQIIWNNSVRNAVFRYLHRVFARRSSAYFLTQRAVKYLDDLIKKQENCKINAEEVCNHANEIHEALGGLLSDLRAASSHENLKESTQDDKSDNPLPDAKFDENMHKTTNEKYVPTDTYLVRLVTPQIQLISDQHPDQCVLVTSETIDLKVVAINDTEREDDEESQLVETRYGVSLHDAQFFVLNREKIKSGVFPLFSSNSYGCDKDQIWPPWVSVECCYDSTPLKEALIIEKTSVTLRYDMPNSLRVQAGHRADSLKHAVTAELIRDDTHRQNRMTVNFPKVVASCDSEQFYATFTVVMDLLIYTEPMQKERSERIDKVLLATDFSNLELAAERVRQLQTDVRNFQDLGKEFLAHLSELNHEAIINLAKIEVEQDHARQELFVMMEAISNAMRKVARDDDTTQLLKWTIGADQVIWHVLDEKHQPFLDVGLANASFNRIEGSDGFNANSIEVGILQAFNLSPDTFYPEMISPYLEKGQEFDAGAGNVISVNWTMLDPIGGIPIVQQFDIKLKPVKVQLESKSWDMLFNYIFPKGADGKSNTESPFLLSHVKKSGETASTMDDYSDSDSDEDSQSVTSSSVDTFYDDTGSVSTTSEMSSIFRKPNLHFRKIIPDSSSMLSGSNSSRRALRDTSPTSSTRSSMTEPTRRPTLALKRLGNKTVEEKSDELSEMINRASKYLSIVQIRIMATVLCISFKGEGVKNILDVHEFRLNLPEIEYENKTWSNMDLVLHLKRDVTKILLNHTGGLIGNKLKKHRKKKTTQKLNQLTNYVAFTPVANLAYDPSSVSNYADSVVSNENVQEEDDDESRRLERLETVLPSKSHHSNSSHSLLRSPKKTASPQSATPSSDSSEKKQFFKRLF